MAKTLTNKKKIIVMSALVLLLAVTAVFNFVLADTNVGGGFKRYGDGGELFRCVSFGTHDDEKRRTYATRRRDRALSARRREIRRSHENEDGNRSGDGKRTCGGNDGEIDRFFRRGGDGFQRLRQRKRIHRYARTHLRFRAFHLHDAEKRNGNFSRKHQNRADQFGKLKPYEANPPLQDSPHPSRKKDKNVRVRRFFANNGKFGET